MTQQQSTLADGARNFATKRGNVPVMKILLGLLLVAFFLLALMLQVQTSEAFYLNGPATTLAPNWSILRQPWDLLHGALSLDLAKAVIWGWGIELVYMVCVVGEVAVHSRVQKWFKFGALILIAYDFWSDFSYGSTSAASGLMGQIAFAGITSFMVAFFGVLGLNMIFGAFLEIA